MAAGVRFTHYLSKQTSFFLSPSLFLSTLSTRLGFVGAPNTGEHARSFTSRIWRLHCCTGNKKSRRIYASDEKQRRVGGGGEARIPLHFWLFTGTRHYHCRPLRDVFFSPQSVFYLSGVLTKRRTRGKTTRGRTGERANFVMTPLKKSFPLMLVWVWDKMLLKIIRFFFEFVK